MSTPSKLLFLMLVICCFSCDDGQAQKATKNNETSKKTINLELTGEELFVKHCKICHGIKGNLQLNGAKDLKLSEMNFEERVVIISEGKNAMTPFKKLLSEKEIKRVAEYVEVFRERKD